MNDILKEQLKSLKNVSLYDENRNLISKSDIEDQTVLIIKSNDSIQYKKSTVIFTFKDYLVNNIFICDFHLKFNKGRTIPLRKMQGQIIQSIGSMYYIKVKGYFYKDTICAHCLKQEQSNPLCLNCFTSMPINQIEDITWEGYVPKEDCVIEEI